MIRTALSARGSYLTMTGLILGILLPGCDQGESRHPATESRTGAVASSTARSVVDRTLFAPLPADMPSERNPITAEKVALGRMLFYDPILSKNHDVSCNSCHDLANHGVDGRQLSLGHKGQKGDRNSPTVYNSALQFVQFWDGRAETIEEQAKGPVLNPKEMAYPSANRVVEVLRSIPGYVEAFGRAFPADSDPVTFDNFAMAVGAFERKLVTPSRWDRLLGGDSSALTPAETQGYARFVEVGCTTCHSGALVGGTMFQKLGVKRPWPNQADKGRRQVTKNPYDDMIFRVSALRNVEKTAPYFHDGSVSSLTEAVKMMASHQLGKDLSDADAAVVVDWLRTLTGVIDADYVKKPELPRPGKGTPRPDAM